MFKVKEKYEQLISKRSNIVKIWDTIEKYCVSSNASINDINSPSDVYDDTIFRAINILVSGLYGYLTTPYSRWFVLKDINSGLALKETDILLELLRMSGFYNVVYSFYKNIVLYGVGCMYLDASNKRFNFKSISPKNFVFSKNYNGGLDTVIIKISLNKNDYVSFFGKEPKTKDDIIEVLFAVYKEDEKIKSEYVLFETGESIRKGVFHQFPFFVGMWESVSDDNVFSSPVIDALPSVLMVNRINKTYWINNEKLANPPLDVPYEGYLGDIDISPGAINFRTTSNPSDRILPIVTAGNINITMQSLIEAQRNIQERLFVDLFLFGETKQMTATEVLQRSFEKMLMLGSFVSLIIENVLHPLVDRIVYLSRFLGYIDLDEYNVDFISTLAQTQKNGIFSGLTMLLNSCLTISQVDGSVNDNINWDKVVRIIGKIFSVPEDVFKEESEVEEIRRQRQELQNIQMQLQLAELKGSAEKQSAQAKVNLSKANKISMESF